ncbi:MAG: CCA tRNA nucleotidyltransferase [Desulfobacteraceae bacterium]|nr:CCA tRNA nucleotidyltransferase [Desulfobacteraceae bacterium]
MEITDKQAEKVISTLHKNGFKALVAGGSVRDFLQGIPSSDFDILTDASIDQVQKIFSSEKVRVVGQSFKICLVNKIEVCPARAQKGRDSFPGNDLEKRDFTINSMAYDPESKTIIDLFCGKEDLKKKIVCFTKDPYKRIDEDPLRIIRACRMASLINGSIDPASKNAMFEKKSLVKTRVSFERIRIEILKAMHHKRPSSFFMHLHETGALKYIFPCLDQCFDFDGGPYHGETVFEHCMMTGDAISFKYPLLRLAGFLHDAGKYDAAVEKGGKLSFAGHEKYTAKIESNLKKLRFSKNEIDYIVSVTKVHMRPLKDDTTPKAVRKILKYLHQQDVDFHDFLRMRIADRKANLLKQPYTFFEIKTRLEKILTELSPDKNRAFTINDLAISGKEIMKIRNIKQSPEVGEILNHLLEKVIEAPELNNKASLEQLILEYK